MFAFATTRGPHRSIRTARQQHSLEQQQLSGYIGFRYGDGLRPAGSSHSVKLPTMPMSGKCWIEATGPVHRRRGEHDAWWLMEQRTPPL